MNARLDVNGARVAELKRGESFSTNLMPGKFNIATDAWGSSGNYKGSFVLEADKEYTFELGPREGSLGVLLAFGALGAAVQSSIDENTGPFSIKLKDVRSIK